MLWAVAILFQRAASTTVRALRRHANVLYAGWCGPFQPTSDDDAHGVTRWDLDASRVLDFHRTAWLVSDVAIAGGRVFASLGPGDLVTWDDLACTRAPSVEHVDANAVRFVVHQGELWWGTYWGEIHALGRAGAVAAVRKAQTTVAVADGVVAAGYEDGKVRVWTVANGIASKKSKTVSVGKPARCAIFDDALWTSGPRGEITRWNLASLREELRVSVPSGPYGVSLQAGDTRLVAFGGPEVRVIAPLGEITGEARLPGNVGAVCVDQGRLFVGVGPAVHVVDV